MNTARYPVAAVLVFIGVLLTCEVAFLLHKTRFLFPSANTFAISAAVLLLQQMAIFAVFVFVVLAGERASVSLPIRLAYVTVMLLAAGPLVLDVLWCNVMIWTGFCGIGTFALAIVVRITPCAILLLCVHAAGVAHRGSHAGAEQRRHDISRLCQDCDRLAAQVEIRGWPLGREIREMADRLRFCEGLRRSSSLTRQVSERLCRLDSLVKEGKSDATQHKAGQLVDEILLLAQRSS